MNSDELEVRRRIDALVETLRGDRTRSHQLFDYVWTMVCVQRGLLRVIREVETNGATQLVLEEVKTGQRRLVSRPLELDAEIEGLAVQALTRILDEDRQAG